MKIFAFQDYKKAIRASIDEHAGVRGYQRQLADAAKCQKSYFSQMLTSDKTHLNQEQLMRLAIFWNLNSHETEYILELLNLAKTTFQPLRKRILSRLAEIKSMTENLSKRYSSSVETLRDVDSLAYYSSWIWSAIHILVGISRYEREEALAERLSLPTENIIHTLQSLQRMGLVFVDSGRWKIKPGHIHLPKDSPFNSTNHSNWRQRAVIDSQLREGNGLHYTVIHSHSFDDFEKLKDLLLKAVDSSRSIIKDSADEEASCLCVDLFRI